MNVGSAAFITATTEVISMLLIGFMVGHLLGWSTMNSVFLGGMLSMSSTTIIIKAFDDLGLRSQQFTGIVFRNLGGRRPDRYPDDGHPFYYGGEQRVCG